MLNQFRGFGAGVASRIVFTFAWLSCTASVVAGGLPCQYEVTAVMDSPFADDIVRGQAINNHNEVCGYYTVGMSSNRAFYWTPQGGFVTIPTPAGGFESVAHDISDAGLVVGVMRFSGSAIGNKGFIHDIKTGQTTFLESEDVQGQCEITGVNESGVVCGFRSVDDGGDPFVPTTAFRWSAKNGFEDMTPAGYSEATDINESNQCSGWMFAGPWRSAVRWDKTDYVILPALGDKSTESWAINDAAVQAGASRIPWPGYELFGLPQWVSWTNGAIDHVGLMSPYLESFGLGVNSNGTLVGTSGPFNNFRAFVVQGGLMRNLNDFDDNPSQFWSSGWDINDGGVILLHASIASHSVSVIYTPQPPMRGDANGTCAVNVEDLLLVIKQWSLTNGAAADLDDSGVVDVNDLIIVLDEWSK